MTPPRPELHHCPKCGLATLLTDWDDASNGPTLGTQRLDVTILTPTQQLAAIITGRTLWVIRTERAGITASRLNRWMRYWHPTWITTGHIIPTHRCGAIFTTPTHVTTDTTTTAAQHDACPF